MATRHDTPRSGSVTGVSGEPWRVGQQHRDELLVWFLNVELASDAAVTYLRKLTGRASRSEGHRLSDGTWWIRAESVVAANEFASMHKRRGDTVIVAAPDAIGPSGERNDAQHRGPDVGGPTTRDAFVTYYATVRGHLLEVQRRAVLVGRTKARDPYGEAFFVLAHLLADVRLDVEREYGRPSRPLRPAQLSLSLVGELALAMFHRLINMRSSVVCPYCKSIETFSDRRPRRICSREACRRAYRNEWKRRNPEESSTVAARVRRHRRKAVAGKKGKA